MLQEVAIDVIRFRTRLNLTSETFAACRVSSERGQSIPAVAKSATTHIIRIQVRLQSVDMLGIAVRDGESAAVRTAACVFP